MRVAARLPGAVRREQVRVEKKWRKNIAAFAHPRTLAYRAGGVGAAVGGDRGGGRTVCGAAGRPGRSLHPPQGFPSL